MEFTKQQLSLFADFYNASQEILKDFEELEVLNKQKDSIEEKIKNTTQKIQVRNTIITGILKGILLEKENTPLLKAETKNLLYSGSENMKYQGITIIKNKNCNTWTARPMINGKQLYISAKTQKDCYNKLKEAIKNKNKDLSKIQKEKKEKLKITFKEWFKKWVELYKKDVKKTTIEDYNGSLNHLKEIFDTPLNQITTLKILELLNKIEFPRRKQKVYELLNDIFNKALQNEIIDKNPVSKIDKPKHKKVNGLALSSEDEKKLEKILKAKNLDIYLVCLYQGLRRGEALALNIEDIDFEKKTITINKSINSRNKIDTTKNVYSNRIIPLFDNTLDILEKYKNSKGRIFNIECSKCQKTYLEIIRKNFDKNYTIHSLRHTFITNCQEAGIPLHIIQKWVGHNIGSSVTNQVYTHTRELAELENIELYNKKIQLKFD